ncbi:MAG: N-acetylmuramoyl-L-alanine amidase [Chloroflexi bacterium]|nr:N-acetylmuramoyl-L-alanine amidase [Chloroflexota bacterium]
MKKKLLILLLLGILAAVPVFSGIKPELVSPRDVLWVMPGDLIRLEVKVPSGGKVKVILAGDISCDLKESAPGLYSGAVMAPGPGTDLSPSIIFKKGFGTTEAKADLKILILSPTKVLTGAVIESKQPLRSGPSYDCDRIGYAPKGCLLQVTGKQDNWWKVKLSGAQDGWVDSRTISEPVEGAKPSHAFLEGIKVLDYPSSDRLRIQLTDKVPYDIRDTLYPATLELTLYCCDLRMFEIKYNRLSPRIKEITLVQEASGMVKVRIAYGAPRFWGYGAQYKGSLLLLDIKRPPKVSEKNLNGLKVLIDPGHGGSDTGALGVYGTNEKDLNLSVAFMLGKMLRQAGAEVFFSRWKDVDLTPPASPAAEELDARVQSAVMNNADIMVSIHHNAKPVIKEARKARGTHVYYYRAQSLPLAEHIARNMGVTVKEPEYVPIWRSFYLIRESRLPSVLVECAFLSNPSSELMMLEKDYPEKAASGIYRGIRDFVTEAEKTDPEMKT